MAHDAGTRKRCFPRSNPRKDISAPTGHLRNPLTPCDSHHSLISGHHHTLIAEVIMINTCINPGCHTELKILNTGCLYAVERRSANTEFIWLCANCAAQFDVYLDPTGCPVISPRSDQVHRRPPHPDSRLLLVFNHTSSFHTTHRRPVAYSGTVNSYRLATPSHAA